MRITILPIFLLISFYSFAQTSFKAKGTVADSSKNALLVNASAVIFTANDSILVNFSKTSKNGSFVIGNIPVGNFILKVSYPGYADYSEQFTADRSNGEHNFGKINMSLRSNLLRDIIIKAKPTAIKVKGDTTEFNAKAFIIQPNDKVEDLLRQLPGIQVDKFGNITAYGEVVSKVLLDGEEFFGDDPKLITKNIRSDMVDKVQLYDKKSDQATLTGIDDGFKAKTINIKLKEDKKKGYFGKLEASAGNKNYYAGQGLYNRFKEKEKIALYTINGNTGTTGLTGDDNKKYADNQVNIEDYGGINAFSGMDDLDSFDGKYNGNGLPSARTAGGHFDTKWKNDVHSVNTNYKLGSLDINGTNSSNSINLLPLNKIFNRSEQTFNNYAFRQKLDGIYSLKLSSESNIKLSLQASQRQGKTNSNFTSSSHSENGFLLNDNNRSLNNDVEQRSISMNLFYSKKFTKPGRTLSVNVNESYNKNQANGYLRSSVNFYKNDIVDSVQAIDQFKTHNIISSILNTNIVYSEPILKKVSLTVNYMADINNSNADRQSFNSSAENTYNILDSSLSNNYRLKQFANQLGSIFNYSNKKTTINWGTKVAKVDYKQYDQTTRNSYSRSFYSWRPQVNVQYKFSQQQTLQLNYNGNNSQPNIDQIQPIRINTDPLNVRIGNPNLRQSFSQNFSVSFNAYTVLTSQSIFIKTAYSTTTDPIVDNTSTDQTGKTISQFVNSSNKGQSNFYIHAYFGRKIPKTEFNFGLYLSFDQFNSIAYSNNSLNSITTATYSGTFQLNRYVYKKYDFNIGVGPNYNINRSTLFSNINNNGNGFFARGSFNLYFPAKFQLSNDINYTHRGKTELFNEPFDRFLLNTALSKKFLKEDNLKLTVSGNDILNQNVGFSRASNANFITQNNFNTIMRYFMLSVTWDFNKMGQTKIQQ